MAFNARAKVNKYQHIEIKAGHGNAPELAQALLFNRAVTSGVISPPDPLPTPANQHRHRVSDCIAYKDALNLLEAAFFSQQCGMPLNRFTTIHWQKGGIAGPSQWATGRFLKLAADWLRLRGATLAYIWVRENGHDKGDHVHILLHVPPDLARAFSSRQRGWLKACGATFKKGVIYSRPIGRTLSHALAGLQYGEQYSDHLKTTLAYILKGANAKTRQRLGLPLAEPGGAVIGKRCSTSQNIGRAARRKRC